MLFGQADNDACVGMPTDRAGSQGDRQHAAMVAHHAHRQVLFKNVLARL
ncbi:hypothetical protein ACGFOU_09195 [Streptomyces sp. NPDC048595]